MGTYTGRTFKALPRPVSDLVCFDRGAYPLGTDCVVTLHSGFDLQHAIDICRGYKWKRTFERYNMPNKLKPYQHQIKTRSQPADPPASTTVKPSSSGTLKLSSSGNLKLSSSGTLKLLSPATVKPSSAAAVKPSSSANKRTISFIDMMKAAGMEAAPAKKLRLN